ncbi:hypothetical protein JHK85_029939 [Glycine max]|uniref:Uncharacterized protein n=1 Tax=Glycine max TaxID=3847 RepID=K7LLJ1_SOYBN|nr:hypothetical protein JHK85_029939 [Glycine max]KAH1140192.1 hypothetical protein GYH30_029202 [Glycine max]
MSKFGMVYMRPIERKKKKKKKECLKHIIECSLMIVFNSSLPTLSSSSLRDRPLIPEPPPCLFKIC